MSPKLNKGQAFKSGDDGGGRSGSFFFFSHDRKYILKTISEDELNVMCECLAQISSHFQLKKNSLLAKIFGVFTIKTKY